MFTIQLEQIATVEKLKESAFAIKSKAVGLDKESVLRYRDDESLFEELIILGFTFYAKTA